MSSPSEPVTLTSPDNRRRVSRRLDDRLFLRHRKELEAARSICEALSQEVEVDSLIKQAITTALEVVGAEAGSVLLADPDSPQLVFRHVIGDKAGQLLGTTMPWDQGIAGAVFQSGQPVVVADVKDDDRHFHNIDDLSGYETRDMIVVPLKRWEGKPIGVLEIMNKKEGRLTENDTAILTIISALTATMIEQARLFEEAKLAEVVRLLGDIGHDLKNLLQPVVAGTWLLKSEMDEVFSSSTSLDPSKATVCRETCDEALGMIQRTSDLIHVRVKEIADAVKGLTSPPQFGDCQVGSVAEEVNKTLNVLAQKKGITLQVNGLNNLPTIQADSGRLFNAFYNLINNAIPEVPSGGTITMVGQEDSKGKGIIISIVDNGKGMLPEIRDSLFSARAISRKAGGTGLGTKIVKDVVDAHKGKITVESELGVGSSFHIFLPLDPL